MSQDFGNEKTGTEAVGHRVGGGKHEMVFEAPGVPVKRHPPGPLRQIGQHRARQRILQGFESFSDRQLLGHQGHRASQIVMNPEMVPVCILVDRRPEERVSGSEPAQGLRQCLLDEGSRDPCDHEHQARATRLSLADLANRFPYSQTTTRRFGQGPPP